MVDKKLIKEKLFYLSDNYCIPISIRDNGSVVFYENDFYKDIEDALISWEVILLDNKNDTNLDFRKEEQEILDIIEELKNKKRRTTDMMNKKELTTLVCAINQSVEWITQRLCDLKSIQNEMFDMKKELSFQVATLEEELENLSLIDKDKELDEYEDELNDVREASEVFLKKLKYIEYIYNYKLFGKITFEK